MKIPNLQLFLTRFIDVNKTRYQNDPEVISLLDNLKLPDIGFSNLRTDTSSGEVVRTVDMVVPHVMNAFDQSWIPADYDHPAVSQFTDTTVLDEDDLEHQTVPGLYHYDDHGVVASVLVFAGGVGDPATAIRELVKERCLYELLDADITVSSDYSTVSVDSPTIYFTLKTVQLVKGPVVIPETDYQDIV